MEIGLARPEFTEIYLPRLSQYQNNHEQWLRELQHCKHF
jgi:hypothetical protein